MPELTRRRRGLDRCAPIRRPAIPALLTPVLIAFLSTPAASQVSHVISVSEFPNGAVDDYRKAGRGIARIRWLKDRWVLTFPPHGGSGYVSDTAFPRAKVAGRWKTQAITDVSYSGRWWLVSMRERTASTLHDQNYLTTASFPRELIDKHWKQGRHITALAHGKGQYVVVMSKGSGYGRQGWAIRDSLPTAYIKESWKEGYLITGLTHANGNWVVVRSKEQRRPQYYHHSRAFPQAKVDSFARAGFEVSDAAYGDSTFLLIFTDYRSGRPWEKQRSASAVRRSTSSSRPARLSTRADVDQHRRNEDRLADLESDLEAAQDRAEREAGSARNYRRNAAELRANSQFYTGAAKTIGLTGAIAMESKAQQADDRADAARGEARRLRQRIRDLRRELGAGFAAATAADDRKVEELLADGSNMRYDGPESEAVLRLLTGVGGWRTPSCFDCSDGRPPAIPSPPMCQRDTYVYAAATIAWAIEGSARLGDMGRARGYLPQLRENLRNADRLRSSAAAMSGGPPCRTLDIY